MPELIAIKLSSIHESLCLFCLRTFTKLHVRKASWQVHSFIHSQLDMLHCAKGRKDLMDMLLLHIPGEVADVESAGLSFWCLILLTNTECRYLALAGKRVTLTLSANLQKMSNSVLELIQSKLAGTGKQLVPWLEVLTLQLAHPHTLPLVLI